MASSRIPGPRPSSQVRSRAERTSRPVPPQSPRLLHHGATGKRWQHRGAWPRGREERHRLGHLTLHT